MCTNYSLLVYRLFKPAQEKVWLGELPSRHAVDLECKARKQTNKSQTPKIRLSVKGKRVLDSSETLYCVLELVLCP